MRRLRAWLARLILGRNEEAVLNFCAEAFLDQLDASGADYLEWWTNSGRTFYAAELFEDEDEMVQCEICTMTFESSPDEFCRCPSCGSTDVLPVCKESA